MNAAGIFRACVCALLAAVIASAQSKSAHFVANGRAADAYSWSNTGGYNLQVVETNERGPDGSASAWLSFGSYFDIYPDNVYVGGWGAVPASAISSSAEFLTVNIPDVLKIPGFYVEVLACSQGNCEWFYPTTGPVPVNLTFRVTNEFREDTNGVTRRRVRNPDGSTSVYTQNGSSSSSSAAVEGTVAVASVPIPAAVSSSAKILVNRGVTTTVERTRE